jgi:TolB-like protein
VLVIVVADSYLLEDQPFSTMPSIDSEVTKVLISTEDVSIAVLAFQSMSDDAEQEYSSDGISEELLNLLEQIRDSIHITAQMCLPFRTK